MSGFKALNIESDDESDIEIDDTKELQIEDALKLYQTALKHHATGPDSYELAAEAYEELFRSEIFKYPESQTELRRIELYGPATDADDFLLDDLPVGVVPVNGGGETGPSTLPQILHLSHKNYAQFKLEYLASRLEMLHVSLSQILNDATAALDHFVEALDKDDSDIDLWRRTSSVGDMLESKRVARFCLEAVLDGDDEALGNALSAPGLDEGLAGEQLRRMVRQLEDELSILQSPLLNGKRKLISKLLKQRLGSFQTILDSEQSLRKQQMVERRESSRTILKTSDTWADVGDSLLRQLMAEQHGSRIIDPAPAVFFAHAGSIPDEPSLISLKGREEQRETNTSTSKGFPMPKDVHEAFPGLDGGRPTTQPEIAPADVGMKSIIQHSQSVDSVMENNSFTSLPTRKRSQDTAGLNDAADEGRAKSKRTRLRESTAADERNQAILDANAQWEFEQQINEIQAADDWMFETVGNLFERIGIIGFEAARNVRQELQSPGSENGPILTNGTLPVSDSMKGLKTDLQAFLHGYSDILAGTFLNGGDSLELGQSSAIPGTSSLIANGSAPRGSSKPTILSNDKVSDFIHEINQNWLMTHEVAWKWISALLRPNHLLGSSTYLEHSWPENLKTMIVRTLVNFDEYFICAASEEFQHWQRNSIFDTNDIGLASMLQSIYELHLDIYCLIKEPKSGVDAVTVSEQWDRLQRWSQLAQETMHMRSFNEDVEAANDPLAVRFLWTSVFHLGATADVTKDHVLECMNDLKATLSDIVHVQLQNNAVIPEISMNALDREISKLTTRDFFLKVTTQDQEDPVSTIETLEPLLMALQRDSRTSEDENDGQDDPSDEDTMISADVVRFVQNSDISVRILLWQHLRDAYISIEYKPMVINCYFNMIKLLLTELTSTEANLASQHERQVNQLKLLRLIQNMISKAWLIIQKAADAFECVDEALLKDAVSSLGEILQLVQVFNIHEDAIRVGQSKPPVSASGQVAATFESFKGRIEDMQVHTWLILYSLLKEATIQFHDLFPNSVEDRFDFLRTVHRNLGLRSICGNLKKVFIRTLRDEFVQMTHIDGYDSEQAQVLYDLYGLNCFLNPSYELIEHHCQHDAFIDKSVAVQAVDLLLQQASKLPIKDLVKHSIKDTIDRVHGTAPRKKPTEAILRNRDIYRAFLRSPINPLDIYGCVKGEGNHLVISYVPKEDAVLASKGWYFLMGHIALAKFRSQKRTSPTPTEDVDIAIAFFMQDLEYRMDKWETWLRLAQAYDTKIEESTVWSAEKLNSSMPELIQLQRSAIHCYTMATALAFQSADLGEETLGKMNELFAEFGLRLYASSREPFSMLPFAVDDEEKFLSLQNAPPGSGVSKGKPFKPLGVYTTWKLAKSFLQRALNSKSSSWLLQLSYAKCIWKMHAASEFVRRPQDVPPSAQDVVASFIKAIEMIPDEKKKDSREKREPVLEPHYKLVSIVHKLVSRRALSLEQAREALSNTPYARTATFPEDEDEWVPHILTVLKTLRVADKSNWHHRMIARSAHIIYDDSDPRADGSSAGQSLGAMGAKHELTQQMFTKTMVLNVWRPDSERAGRHFVYTARYTRFFVGILEQLNDRANLEMLARRVRRRTGEIFEHSLVWQEICHSYLKLIRNFAAVPEGLETSTFSNIAHDDFLARRDLLEKWMQSQQSGSSTALDALREVQELKKINQSLMKPGPIDDLIGDAYAYIFNTVGKQLWDDQQRVQREEETNRAPPPLPTPPRNPMMSLTHLMNVDGSNEAPAAQIVAPTITPAAAQQPDQAPVRRKIGVGRREIRTSAEACVQKSQAASSSIASSRLQATYPRVQVVIETSGTHTGDASVDTSAPGSIHDSADDESELSDLDEEGEDDEGEVSKDESRARVMFPGLLSNVASREASTGFVTADEESGAIEEDVEMDATEAKENYKQGTTGAGKETVISDQKQAAGD